MIGEEGLEGLVDGVWHYPAYVDDNVINQAFSENALTIAHKQFLTRDNNGETNQTLAQRFYQVAFTLAQPDGLYGASERDIVARTKKFYGLMEKKEFCPGGRVLTNAGTEIKALFNCYVLPVEDSLEDIYQAVKNAAIVHKNGGGTGYNFSSLRPRGTYVKRSKGIASGPVSFIRQFDGETSIINSGNRRGANMGILNIDHPDILDFIYAKAARGEITNFNISCGTTDLFMEAVQTGEYYTLHFNNKPYTAQELKLLSINISKNKAGGSEVGEIPRPPSLILAQDDVTVIDSYNDKQIGRISAGIVQLDAGKVMDIIAELAWKTGDPGMIYLDAINRNNPIPNVGQILATNPCGEQPLHPDDACNLGSLNLETMVKFEQGQYVVDFEKLSKTTRLVTRFMENVNDANEGPLDSIEQTVKQHRRIGLGVMGWHDMLIKLGISYDSEEASKLGEKVMQYISDQAKQESVQLGKERGTFQPFEGSVYDTGREEDRVRNMQRTTIAPTGTISMLFDCASGIEPYYAVAFNRNLRGGDTLIYGNKHFERIARERGFYSKELLEKVKENHGSVQGMEQVPDGVQKLFRTAHDISYDWHVRIQAAFQRGTDNAVSKTINMRNDATVEEVKGAYLLAYNLGCKGITVYRDGAKKVQVLQTMERKVEGVLEDQLRSPRPDHIGGLTEKLETPFGTGFLTFNRAKENGGLGRPYEAFLSIGRGGQDIAAIAEGLGRLMSLGLKAGVPPGMIIEQLRGIGGETQTGFGSKRVRSLPDGVALALESILRKEGINAINGNSGVKNDQKFSGNFCQECKSQMIFEEGCMKCTNPTCGYSKCG